MVITKFPAGTDQWGMAVELNKVIKKPPGNRCGEVVLNYFYVGIKEFEANVAISFINYKLIFNIPCSRYKKRPEHIAI